MADDEPDGGNIGENILYHLTIPAEWTPEQELNNKVSKEKSQVSLVGRATSAAYRSTWTALRGLGIPVSASSPCTLPPALVQLNAAHLNWHIATSPDGRYVAVLQDSTIEIRTSRDEYDQYLTRYNVSRDTYPQWRQLVWSIASDMLAISDSNGRVEICDITGSHLCTIPAMSTLNPKVPLDLSNAVAGLIFKEYSGRDNWGAELLVVNYQGSLRCYLIGYDREYQLHHSFTFSSHYPQGVNCVEYDAGHGLLLIGGSSKKPDSDVKVSVGTGTAMKHGLTVWRSLSDAPHYTLVTDYEHDLQMARKRGWMGRIMNLHPFAGWYSDLEDGIYKLRVSPDGSLLAAVHLSGTFSLWELPSLRLKNIWPQNAQPGFDDQNASIAENPKRRKVMKEYLEAYNLLDANWWSDEAVILSRGTGALCVSSVNDLRNLLGTSAEWFEPGLLITGALNGSFLGLECETKFHSLKRRLEEEEEFEDSDEDEDATMVMKTSKYMRQALYFVTDSERFRPPKKRPKLVSRIYRLVCMQSTTPEELYARKIKDEEYGEALLLARAYNLDCDLVYQKQWRATPVSVASIQDYLSKISKRSWVLHECLERVPENIDAMKELLQYGLRGTDLEALIAIGKGQDAGRFMFCDRHDVYMQSLDYEDEGESEEMKRVQQEHVNDLLEQVNFHVLNLEQKELCRARTKLLQYLDRLATYEEILGGVHAAEERFDHKFFEKFRSQNIVELATEYARSCDWRALDVLLTYHGDSLLPHRLAILANFPETFPISEYSVLLPEAQPGRDEVVSWETHTWRTQDWVEAPECRLTIEPNPPDLGAFLYEENPDLIQFRGAELTGGQLTAWYQYRACEIEMQSCQVDNALTLIKQAIQSYNIQDLEVLHDDLLTMETMVYECYVDDNVGLSKIQKMTDLEKLQLIMSKSSDEMYKKNIHRWLKPFLDRCENRNSGSFNSLIHDYLVAMAGDDLWRCRKVFESSRADRQDPVIAGENLLIPLALECIYACERNDQLTNAFGILECLPQHGFGSEVSSDLHAQVDELECHLSAAEILSNNGLPQTIAFIRDTQSDADETISLFTKLTRVAGRKEPPLTGPQWKDLLKDVLALRQKAYRCIQPSVCYEIFVKSLLCSSRLANIVVAGEMMEQSAAESREPHYPISDSDDTPDALHKVPYNKAIELVLGAANEYFDSSTDLVDSNMDLARACLALIVDQPKEIKQEVDLIESLAVLDGFGVSILPPQVRMCADRLELVSKAIEAKPHTYKNSQRLLKLGYLLRICGDDASEREGRILQLVTQAAIKAGDHRIAHETCLRLMDLAFAPVWTECKALAEAEEFQDIQVKVELLSFAVTHCSSNMIEPILRAKCLLETQILNERVQWQLRERDSTSPPDQRVTTDSAIKQTKQILSSTTKTTVAMLSSVSDGKWWRRTLASLHPARRSSFVSGPDWEDMNTNMEQQGCHPFYEEIIENAYSNKSEADYAHYRLPKLYATTLDLSEAVLRKAKLTEMLTEGEADQPTSEVILRLAQDIIAQDTALGIAYLLALPKVIDAEMCFEKNPRTGISLQIAAYYYALQIFVGLENEPEPEKKACYSHKPEDVIHLVADYVTKLDSSKWPAEVAELIPQLKHYEELLMDFNQAQVLRGLGRGVDVARFTQDAEYKQETILGLAMTLDQSVYEIALSLAKRYKLPKWDVFMTHLEFLFDSGISTSEIEVQVKQRGILPTLLQNPAEFARRMRIYVFPSLNGTDHARLLYYYTLLEDVTEEGEITPALHVKLLKKIKPAAPGLDYKKLTEGKVRPLEVIQPVLNTGNVHVLAKLAPRIPDPNGGFLETSLVFCAWASKVFWEGEPGSKKVPDSEPSDDMAQQEWIHRYEWCGEYLQRMGPRDVSNFIEGILFVPQALDRLTLETRQEIVRRAVKFCGQQSGKKIKENKNGGLSWEDARQQLVLSQQHLQLMRNETIIGLQHAEDEKLQAYARAFDMSRSENHKLQLLLKQMVIDGQDPSFIEDILEVQQVEFWTPQTAIHEAIIDLIKIISGTAPSDTGMSPAEALDVLRRIIQVVSDHQENGGDLVSSEHVMELLRPFCADSAVPVQPRLDILKLLEQSFKLGPEDLSLLIFYRTDALVSSQWTHRQVAEVDVASELGRQSLYEELLKESQQLSQFLTVTRILHVWPPLQAAQNCESVDAHPWSHLVERMVIRCGEEAGAHLVTLVKDLNQIALLSENCVSHIFSLLQQHNMITVGVKVILTFDHTSLYDTAVEELCKHRKVTDDNELLLLILKRHLVANMVSTPYYAALIDYIIEHQDINDEAPYHLDVATIANQLAESGLESEAAALMMRHRGMHRGMSIFSMTSSVLSNWLQR